MDEEKRLPQQEEWRDLLPVEKELIGYSLGLGIVLLVVLVWVSHSLL
ncbi:MAG: hypothetical protein ACPL5F_04120 [Moorellaceae bacterium]